MGIIHAENYDAFISYAYDDNVLHDDAVRIFKQYFEPRFRAEYRLKVQTQNEVELFMDKRGLPANGDLTNELQGPEPTLVL